MLEWNNFQKIFVKFMFPFKLNLVLKQIIRCVVFMIKKLLFWCLKVLLILLTFLDYDPVHDYSSVNMMRMCTICFLLDHLFYYFLFYSQEMLISSNLHQKNALTSKKSIFWLLTLILYDHSVASKIYKRRCL